MSSLNAKILALLMLFLGAIVLTGTSDVRLPGNHAGYEPRQPIAYSHRLHAGELQIDCQYCHHGAESSRHAGIPSASICMNCHATVTAGLDATLRERELAEAEGREPVRLVSPELRKLYDAVGLGGVQHDDDRSVELPLRQFTPSVERDSARIVPANRMPRAHKALRHAEAHRSQSPNADPSHVPQSF